MLLPLCSNSTTLICTGNFHVLFGSSSQSAASAHEKHVLLGTRYVPGEDGWLGKDSSDIQQFKLTTNNIVSGILPARYRFYSQEFLKVLLQA